MNEASTSFAKDQLKAVVERIERLEEEKKAIADDIRDVYSEAKARGFDTTALRTIVRMRKIDADERHEAEAILETYMHALGMLSDLPLGKAAIEREFGDTKVVIEGGGVKFETTAGDLSLAAAKLKTPAGKRAVRKAVRQAKASEGARDLVNPNSLPDKKTINAIADRAEKRSRGNDGGSSAPPTQGGSAPPSAAPAAASAASNSDDAHPVTLDKPGCLSPRPQSRAPLPAAEDQSAAIDPRDRVGDGLDLGFLRRVAPDAEHRAQPP